MQATQIIRYMEDMFPPDTAMDYDNVGLLTGDEKTDVERVYIALDVTMQTIAEASLAGAQMIISHHPVIFSPLRRLTPDTPAGRRVWELARRGILSYAAHTNYDVCKMGQMAAARLGIEDGRPLAVTQVANGQERGIGRIGHLQKEMELDDFGALVRDRMELTHVRVYGPERHKVRRVALCPGSGKSVIEEAIRQKADVLVAGDIGHHEGIDATEQGLAIVDPGHYGSEWIFVDDVASLLTTRFPDLRVIKETIRQPLRTV